MITNTCDIETGSNYDTYNNTISQIDDDDASTIVTTAIGIETKRSPREQQLAAKESKKIHRTKFFVMFFLLVIMVGVSIATYYMISREEHVEFVHQFNDDSHKILSSMGSNFVRNLEASDAFVVSITSLASVTNQEWPFVVVPDFAVRAEKIRSLANAVYVSTYNLVQPNQRNEWEKFTAEKGESIVIESITALEDFDEKQWPVVWNYTLWDVIHDYDEFEKENPGQVGVVTPGPWLPMWQTQPTISYEPPYNWDLMSGLGTSLNISAHQRLLDNHKVTVTDAYLISHPDDEERLQNDKEEAEWISSYLLDGEEPMEPISDIFYPILSEANKQIKIDEDINSDEDGKNQQHQVVGIFSLAVYWRDTIKNILPDGHDGLIVVFENPCNPTFTYQINGPNVTFIGVGDFHEKKYNHMAVSKSLSELSSSAMKESSYSGIQLDEEFCPFKMTVYPSQITKNQHSSEIPMYFAVVTVIVFAATALTFIIYDFWVERRQRIVMKTAMSTTKLVASLFPDLVIDRMLPSLQESASSVNQPKKLQSFLKRERDDELLSQQFEMRSARSFSKPIADLFPDTTVFFADIAGFTAWSSVREPSHVFVLLETIYGSFDKIARQYGIFKVETIGDSYVAVCGLPEPRKNHAVAMAKFAFACVEKMKEKTREMELTLGPGTADLRLRTGLHSGPTIAGVLRGEKARFQLFGDTVNTASRMESTGEPNKIQVSQQTADLLISAGRESWLTAREELVSAKGKGQLKTYWLARRKNSLNSATSDVGSDLGDSPASYQVASYIPKIQRLIDWNVSIFTVFLEEIVALRHSTLEGSSKTEDIKLVNGEHKYIRDEVVETIPMPDYTSNPIRSTRSFIIDPKVIKQLRDYITQIADFYHAENNFHNFEHASHVIMSTVKLLQRIATPDVRKKDFETEQDYYNYTFGINSDPLTKFAIVFSALIHDVDHQGVSNFQLSKEKDPMAKA
mmetsp:Transcript_1718/g.4427  ORF Transcript_1718/g.4427 Transcript_1718/m.4427 type:complete len:967 (-) Transcript_1718:770-3670(-)|eukprot:CAMPEP_0197186830 /NCGR_PEP_ID=MMETSP1423-20130617/14656_1 /TAXON_ID=476441 /ORGANISM="Pseudo-nitzschia heimii, Strain UNC1101" /LENGTH=966 /DNA_ID=CAMNT_0042638245 /DNA_START=54 /DNA_END=2954 /DNA_ORIENTATION=+